MEKRIQIGLVGDFNEKMYIHVALNDAITHGKSQLNFSLKAPWLPTEILDDNFLAEHRFEGFWIAPGSPIKRCRSLQADPVVVQEK